MPAGGNLRGARVIVEDEREGNQLYNKGAFGTPVSGGGVELDLVEAAYLVEEKKLEALDGGKPLSLESLVAIASRLQPEFEIRYLVYRDMRKRGYLVKSPLGPLEPRHADFHLYPRGGLPGKTASTHTVFAISERGTFQPSGLLEACASAREQGKHVLLAIVDEEGDLTYYEAGLAELAGTKGSDAPLVSGEASLLDDRVSVWNPEIQKRLTEAGYGNAAGPSLQISLVEAFHLLDAGLTIRDAKSGRMLSRDDYVSHARKVQSDFDLRFRAYRNLKARGMTVKTGFKFGTHFRAYKGGVEEGHAPFLVHALPEGYACAWPDVSGTVRLAHTVRKQLVFAIGERFLRLKRARP